MTLVGKLIMKIYKKLVGTAATDETVEDLKKRGVKIGEDVVIYSSVFDRDSGSLIEVGNHVTITNAVILTHDASTQRPLGFSKHGKVKIGNHVFVGYGSMILPGVEIGDNVIIGAGTVVRKSVPANSVVIGNPAQIVCDTDVYLAKNKAKHDKEYYEQEQMGKNML